MSSNSRLRPRLATLACAVSALSFVVAADAQRTPESGGEIVGGSVILYEGKGFTGRSVRLDGPVERLNAEQFNDRAGSIRIEGGTWQLCIDARYGGNCVVIDRDVADLGVVGLNNNLSSLRPVPRGTPQGPVVDTGRRDDVILYDGRNFVGQAVGIDGPVQNLTDLGFNDRAGSVRVRGGIWLVCEDSNFRGRCDVIDFDLADFDAIGLEDRISSIAPYDGRAYDGAPQTGGGGGYHGGGRGRQVATEGPATVFFPEPLYRGRPIEARRGAATQFCYDQGLDIAIHAENSDGYLTDVLCRK